MKNHSVLLQDSEEALPSQGRERPGVAGTPTRSRKDRQPGAVGGGERDPHEQTLPRATLHAQGLRAPTFWGWRKLPLTPGPRSQAPAPLKPRELSLLKACSGGPAQASGQLH